MTVALITGANGFIGSHLARELLARGYEVRGLVRHSSDLGLLRGLSVALYLGDVRQPESLIAPLQGVEYVFHLAAVLMATSRQAFEQTNTQGTIHLLEAAERYAASTLKRFLFVSSQAAAGPGEDPTPIDEQREPRPISWYGTSKMRAEEAVRGYAERLPVTIVRPSSVYGEGERDIAQTFPLIGRRLQPVLGLQTKYTVMVYVGDLVRGFVDAAESVATLKQTYFLNHPRVLTAKEIVTTIAKAMDKALGLQIPVPLLALRLAAPFAELAHHFSRNRPPLTRDKAREIGRRFWVADPSKAKRDFGWEAEHDVLQGMRITTASFLEEEKQLRLMPLESNAWRWFKYVTCAVALGSMIEISSAVGGFYRFTPWWTVFLVVFGAFGLSLGTLAMWLRRQGEWVQLLAGTALAGALEALNALGLVPFVSWQFAPGWPFGITDLWVRSLVLGLAGGAFVLLVNALARLLYRRRLKLG
jgi:nucleoside-diphosphate-sugar epimerase